MFCSAPTEIQLPCVIGVEAFFLVSRAGEPMKLTGEIPVLVDFYQESEREQWRSGQKQSFPWDPRLAWTTYQQPAYYFGETWYARKLLSTGHLCWSDKFQLFQKVPPNGSHFLYSEEIRSLLGEKQFALLLQAQSHVSFPLKNPDLAAYHPRKNAWSFFEVKLPGDSLNPGQVDSLALLQYLLNAYVAVVKLYPNTQQGTRQDSTLRYEFDFQAPTH